MTEYAKLVVSVDSRQVRTADSDLDRLGRTAGRTESSTNQLTGAFRRLAGPLTAIISAREIAALNVGADLVVLSACETGLGRTLAGEGPLSLSWSFLAAGARQVVSSLWAVSDKSTSDLMVEFYRQLAEERLPAAQALREAQLKLKRDPRTRSPFFWAAFIITGKPITRNERQARLTG